MPCIFYGGTPMAIVPDNLKSAVIKSDRNEPIINEEFAAFAEFYNCAVYPATDVLVLSQSGLCRTFGLCL